MKPSISVIVPVEPGGSVDKVLGSLKCLNYPPGRIEVLMAEGKQPSKQRNKALQEAKGEIVYFLDSDSIADSDLFTEVVSFYEKKDIAGVGGPNLTLGTDSLLQKCFGYILSSLFGVFSIRYRYKSIGQVKEANENMLILCNLSMRRAILEKEGAFNESLYPNEENELINRLRAKGYRFIYNPQAIVYRSRRKTIPQFCKQIGTYGRGRMEQTFVDPTFFNWLRLGPLLFCFYLISLPFKHTLIYLSPFLLYALTATVFSISIAWQERSPTSLALLPPLFLLTHLSYGIGLFWGFVKKIIRVRKAPQAAVIARRVKSFQESSFFFEKGGRGAIE